MAAHPPQQPPCPFLPQHLPPGAWPVPGSADPAPLHLPQHDATIGQAASRFSRTYADFSRRAGRSEYWWWTLISVVVSVELQVIGYLAVGGRLVPGASSTFPDLRG